MAIQTFVIDPTGAPDMTGDEIVAAIDAGAAAITRPDALDQTALKLVLTQPVAGQFKIKSVQRTADEKLEVSYDDVVEV